MFWEREKWGTVRMNIDSDDASPVQLMRDTGCYLFGPGWNGSWNSYHWDTNDFWIRYYNPDFESYFGGSHKWLLFFNYDYCVYDGDLDFEQIQKADCAACTLIDVPTLPISTGDYEPVDLYIDGAGLFDEGGDILALSELPGIFIMKTSSGNWAKIRLDNPTTFMDPSCPYSE
jgi:hypothetical protein